MLGYDSGDIWPLHLPNGATLRPLALTDAPALHALIDHNRAHLLPWLPWIDLINTLGETLLYLEDIQSTMQSNIALTVGLWQGEALRGVLEVYGMNGGHRSVNMGYWLAAAAQGQGLASTAVRALTRHAIADLQMNRIEIRCATDNARSRAVAERCGFRLEGVLREAEWLHVRFADLAVYSLLAREWDGR
jgi:ribosomal-protein-serine acetyltransferase